jgi:hypothetical protein
MRELIDCRRIRAIVSNRVIPGWKPGIPGGMDASRGWLKGFCRDMNWEFAPPITAFYRSLEPGIRTASYH